MITRTVLGLVRRFFQVFPRRKEKVRFNAERPEYIEYCAGQTPSHLRGLLSADSPDLGLDQRGYYEDIAIGYRLTCSCGAQKFEVSAYLWYNPDFDQEVLLSPVTAVCSDCQTSIVVFDSRSHGYDPVVCNYCSTTVSGADTEGAKLKRLSTLDAPETLDIILYYTDDIFDAEFDEFVRLDCFSWIDLFVSSKSSPNHRVLEFECA